MALPSQPLCEVSHVGIYPTINTLVTLEAVLNPSSDVQPFIDQLCVSERLLVGQVTGAPKGACGSTQKGN